MTGADYISEERERQIVKYGYTTEHDDDLYADGSLMDAALQILKDCVEEHRVEMGPPDDPEWFKRGAIHVGNKYDDQFIQRLSIASAMIAAEIDRIQHSANG